MNPFSLENKTILVTGASSGIGRESAIRISKMGGKLVLSARRIDELKITLGQLEGSGHMVLPADQTLEEEIDQLVAECPPIDGLIHSAGIVRPFPVKFIGKKQVDQLFDINYLGPVLLNSKLFKKKKINKGASIVFMSSISSQFPHKGGALYSGAKAALNAYCKVIALEYAPQKVRANYISAAMVRTPLFDDAEKAITKEMMDEHGKHYPLGFGDPDDIAHAAIFLLSDASKWITGTGIVMDGGLSAGQ